VLQDKNDCVTKDAGPNKKLIGWKDSINGYAYIMPDAALEVINQLFVKTGKSFVFTKNAVLSDLIRSGLSEKNTRDGRSTYVIRAPGVNSVRVIKIKLSTLEEGGTIDPC
jgi:hypothetical protein